MEGKRWQHEKPVHQEGSAEFCPDQHSLHVSASFGLSFPLSHKEIQGTTFAIQEYFLLEPFYIFKAELFMNSPIVAGVFTGKDR